MSNEYTAWVVFAKIMGAMGIVAIVAISILLLHSAASADDAGTWQVRSFEYTSLDDNPKQGFMDWVVTMPEDCDIETVNMNNRFGDIIAYYHCP